MSFLAVGCTLLSLLGQGAGDRRELPLEREDDPPAFFKPIGRSPKLVVPFGAFTSYQVNVDPLQQNIVGDAANEPSLCLDPNNPDRIAIGWRQFDNVASNFRQSGYGYSTDGGLTWTFPGKLENNVFRSDPVLASRYDGNFYYLSLLETFFDDIWLSSTGGFAWTRVAAATGGDKQWFTIDNTNSSGRGFMYQLWSTAGNNYSGRQFSRSTDNGATWLNPINITNKPIWGTLDVDSNGNLFLGGWSSSTNSFKAVRSQNAKNSAVTPTFDLSTTINLGGSIDNGSVVNPGGLTGQMWMATDKSAAGTSPVYALCSVAVNAANPADVMFARSLDSIATWQAPVRVNDDPLGAGKYHWFGAIGVGPTGRIDVAWNDTRDDATNATSSLYYAYSLDGGQHFSANIRVSPSFNQSLGYPNQNKMGDYLGVVSNSVGANIAYAATFNGEQDVYFLKIPSPVVVAPNNITVPGGFFTGSLANLAAIDGNTVVSQVNAVGRVASKLDVIVEGIAPTTSPKALLFNIVSIDNHTSETESVAFYNWATGQYEPVGSKNATTSYSHYNFLATGDASRFVNAGGLMRARVRYDNGNGASSRSWLITMDQAVWHVIP